MLLIFSSILRIGGSIGFSFYPFFSKMVKKYPISRYSYLEPCHIRLKLNLADRIQFSIFTRGCYEREDCLKLFEIFPKDGIFFDLGGNIGTYSLVFSSKAREIFTFEATKETFDYFCSILYENNIKNINPQFYAVHDTDDLDIPIYSCNPMNIGANSMYREDGVLVNNVKSITLDTFVKFNDIKKIDIIKVDIEGNELNALKGGMNVILNFRPVILCEIVRTNSGISYATELFEFITKKLYYQGKVLLNDKLVDINNVVEHINISNIFFFPKD
jgi:FkbM family methyltransferase